MRVTAIYTFLLTITTDRILLFQSGEQGNELDD